MSMHPELAWITEARKYLGLTEIKGSKHDKTIITWLERLKAWWRDDETAWCGVFIAHCLASAGMQRGKVNSRSKNWTGDKAPPNHYPYNWYGAIEYMKEGGTKLNKPCYGCVAVKTRKGGGHVAFVVGQTHSGMLVCLGGNQNNKVSYALYRPTDFDAFMWYGTTSSPASHRYDLPVLRGITETSVSEA